jgi:hypothetical protein
LPHIRAECFDVTSLAFSVNRFECQTRFAAATGARDDRQLPKGKIDIDPFEIILARPTNLDEILRDWHCPAPVLRNLRTHWKYSLPLKRFANSVAQDASHPERGGGGCDLLPEPVVLLTSDLT